MNPSRPAVVSGVVVQDVGEDLGDVGDDVEADAAGFLLGKVHHDVDHAVGTGHDGHVLQVEAVRLHRRFKECAEPVSFRVVCGGGFSLTRSGLV